MLRNAQPSRVGCTIDLHDRGKRRGSLTIPWSRNDSAWGSVRVPITVVRGGDGPTVLVAAGSHGDEYEGPLALFQLAAELEPEQVPGRVILLPTMNHPAVQAATRLSPIDGRNLNRSFPGRHDGGVTEMLAQFVLTRLVARADAVLDLHSGGKSLDFVPSACMHALPDRAMTARTETAVRAFGAPVALILEELDSQGMLDTAVEDAGKLFVTTELGGGGASTPRTVEIARRGVLNVLRHLGAVAGAVEPPAGPQRFMRTPGAGFVAAGHAGLVEHLVELGAEVAAEAPLARIHFLDEPERTPALYVAPISGMLYARHFPGLVQPGDCLAVLAVDA